MNVTLWIIYGNKEKGYSRKVTEERGTQTSLFLIGLTKLSVVSYAIESENSSLVSPFGKSRLKGITKSSITEPEKKRNYGTLFKNISWKRKNYQYVMTRISPLIEMKSKSYRIGA